MSNGWELTLQGHDQLLAKMEKYSSQSEKIVNQVLKESGSNIAVKKIEQFIPVSEDQLRSGRKHAKFSNPLKVDHINLGFIVRPKKKFDYIKYPDLGIGHSTNNQPEEFMKRGLQIALDPITEEIVKGFDKLNE